MKATIDFLFEENPGHARRLMEQFRTVGLETPMHFGESLATADGGLPANDAAVLQKRQALLVELGVSSLDRAVGLFDTVMEKIVARLKKAERLRTFAAIVTAILASGVVAALLQNKDSPWAIPLGLLSLASSLASVLAGRLEGGDMNLMQNIASIVGKH